MKQVPVIFVPEKKNCPFMTNNKNLGWRVATRTQKRSCVHIENFDKNENMVNLGHKVE